MAKNANSPSGASQGWISRFGEAPALPPDWSWSEEQRERDDYQIKLLSRRLRVIHDPQTGKPIIPDTYYAISRTIVEVKKTEILPGCAPGHALLGGLVTYQEALLEFPQPDNDESTPENLPAAA